MTKILFLLLSWSFTLHIYAQKVTSPVAINSCYGAVNIFESGEYKLQFTSKKSSDNLEAYPSLSEISNDNLLWCSFIASNSGELTFNAHKKEGFLQMVVFTEEQNDLCGEINKGIAEIKRLHIKKDQTKVGLDYEIGGGVLYSLRLKEGDKIQVLFATEKDVTDKLFLDWKFSPTISSEMESKIVDKRYDDFAPTFSIKVRDKQTNEPLVANVSIEGAKNIDALYRGSDLFFNVDRNCKLKIKCDVEGYFFDDRIESISSNEDVELIIPLDIVSSGKSLKIEDIEFIPGTSQFVHSSESKLQRLKDFLALNSELNIEIQGHVFSLGDNSMTGQRISEARAKRVLKYLIENGIDKSRLKAVGYGNTRPVFSEPKFSYEEQANRRVEIMVL